MGEQKRKNYFLKRQEEAASLGNLFDTSNGYLEIKRTPPAIQQLARMLQQPEYAYYAKRAEKGKDFGEVVGSLAADLGIAVDGFYDYHSVLRLVEIIIEALPKAEKLGSTFDPSTLSSSLVKAEMLETANEITLVEVGQALKNYGPVGGQSPYTVCRDCITSYDCCSNRTCELGKPADQLGDTMSKLQLLKESIKQ